MKLPIPERLRGDRGLVLVLVALAAALALYAPTIARGVINYDEPWLIRDNWIVQHPSWSSLSAILFDTSTDTRAVLGAEYLPVRDLSVMLDFAVWGDWFGGFHLTNVLLYLAAIALWFAAFAALGLDRTFAGLAVLIWAVHPGHAESVAWLAERKGLLAAVFAAVVTYGYARFRKGGSTAWLVIAVVAAPLAIWSKALAAFTLVALLAFEWLLPAPRVSWRRSLLGLGTIALAAAAAFVPVLIVATRMAVVETQHASGGWLATVLGVFGFYVRLGAMTVRNSVAYPISTDGPSLLDIALGAIGLVAAIAVLVVPARGRWQPSPVLRAGVVLWLVGWFPVSRLVFPVRLVIAADRYLLLPTLGLALVIAAAICALRRPQLRLLLGAVIVVAGFARSLDAQANWADSRALWRRAVETSPHDGNAWSQYVETLAAAGDYEGAQQALDRGLTQVASPRLMMHQALLFVRTGDRAQARDWMARAADAGEPRAMANLALMLVDDGQLDAAATSARRAIAAMPGNPTAYRALGRAELALGHADAAYDAFARALAIEPQVANRFNLALALLAQHRYAEARTHLLACVNDAALGAQARQLLAQLPR